jgi:hypothetical protein
MKKHKLIAAGAVIFVLSVIVGIVGTAFGILNSFTALNGAESAGIERVGNGVESAMIFSAVSVTGSTIGLVLMAAGAIASYRRSKRSPSDTE